MKSLYIKEYDALVSYYDLGEGEDILIFLPGLNSPAMPLFADIVYHPLFTGYRSILIDYFGCGMSDSPTSFNHDMESHAKVVLQILDHEKIYSCKIIGHSMGGTVGIYIAGMRPELVAKLVLAESNLSPGGGVGTKWITSFSERDWIEKEYKNYILTQRNRAKEGDAHGVLIAALWKDVDPRGVYLSSLSLVTLPDTFKLKLYDLTIPRYFIYGEKNYPKDPMEVTPDTPDPEELQKYGIEPITLPNSGHFMQVDNLNGFIETIHKCLM
ncbi:MAG: alpha/beta fold hydrolase [Candidatus Hodarchaeales archaeon]|jgi:pimeloyl-ACP methyl ester carboxylesterase